MNPFILALTALGVVTERWDDAFTATLEKQLEYVKTQTYDIVYPDLKARMFIPVSNEADPGAETITYRQWDEFGMAQIIANYADDLPLIDALVDESVQRVRSIGAAYQYSIQDLRRSAMANSRLEQRRARAARRAIEQKIENIAATGDTSVGLYGIANNPNVTSVSAVTGSWASATGAQMVADMNHLAAQSVTLNKETFLPDTLLLDITSYNLFANTRISTTGDTHTSALEAFLKGSPYVKEVHPWYKLAKANAAGSGPRAICYTKSPEVLTLEIPQEFEQMPPQAKNLSFLVPAHARIGGVIIYYPIGVHYMDGL
jgi:hypothetical protein